MRRFKIFAAAAVSLASLSAPAASAIIVYTDRAAFGAAAGFLQTETFNGFTSDTSFQTAALDVGAFTLAGFGPSQFDRNFIDIPPPLAPPFDIDGTAVVNAVTHTSSGFDIFFDSPISAFGADFAALQNGFARTQIIVAGQSLQPPVQAADTLQFYGFTSDTAFTSVRFIGTGLNDSITDGFSMDNVSFGGVPEPATWLMMIGGFGMIGGALRRRRRQALPAAA
ncbi:MAG TPA: PEPxxWA-CTERM sorting domain-containing protein [Allosphingosinicella sp.]|jgi:hypothetical protein